MKAYPSFRATLYLLISLAGMLLGSLFPTPVSSLCHLLSVLLSVLIERRYSGGECPISLSLRPLYKTVRLWLILPAFVFFTLLANLLSASMTIALGGTLPAVESSPALLIGAVLLAPVAEELLFRGLLIRLFRPFGDMWAIALSALLFSFAHGSVFQMPYALIAGLFLGYLATAGGSLAFPLVFHVCYNLLAYFGHGVPHATLLWSLGGLALFSLALFLLGKMPPLAKGKTRPDAKALFPLVLYGAAMTVLALLNF